MSRPVYRCLLGIVVWVAAAATSAAAQPPAAAPAAGGNASERIDPSLTGLARARALARLVDRKKNDRPAEAIAHGREALELFARFPDPAAHVATLNEMAWAFMTLGRYEESSAHANYGIVLADSTGDVQGKARAMSNLGTLAQRRGDPEEAVARFSRALALQRQLGLTRDAANSLNNLGFVYATDLAEYDVALEHHQQALAVRERLGDSSTIALSLNNIGIVHARLGQHPLAREYFERALEMRRALGEQARIAATLGNLADTYQAEGDLAQALGAHRDAYHIRREVKDPTALATAHRSLATVFDALGQRDSARVHLTEALRLGDSVGDHGLRVRNLLALAALERREGRVAVAEPLTRQALQIAEDMPSRDLVQRALEVLADVQEARGDHRGALATHRRFKATSDSIFTEGTGRRIAGLERKYEMVRRERALAALQRAEAQQALTTQRRTVQRNSFALLAALLAVGIYLLHRRRTERTELAEQLSVTDPLTGVRNRRFVQQTVASDVSAVARRHRAAPPGVVPADSDVVFLLIDIDHFKRVNDAYGHAAGDRLLQQVARQLTAILRDSDVVARWGGEEFLVVSRFTNRERAHELAERIRRKIEALETALPGGAVIRVTCSIGFAAYPFSRSAPESVGWEGVVSIADLACYAAKREGRNVWATFRAAQTEAGDVSLNDVTLADIDARVAEGQVVLEHSRPLVDEPA